jgi:hypothetical protein
MTKMGADFMGYTRGSAEDFDRYASVTGDDGWSWNSLIPYILKVGNEIYPQLWFLSHFVYVERKFHHWVITRLADFIQSF